jgi:RNA polymerase sigma factor (sigma-70 family)
VSKNLYSLVQKTKDRKEEDTLELLELFDPLINKYGRLLLGEDTKQDLKLHLFRTIEKMPLERIKVKNNKVIFSYLAKAIRYEYIRLSKTLRKTEERETVFEIETYEDETTLNSEIFLLEMMEVLTKREAFIVDCIYVNCLSSTEVAHYLGVSRQSVNQTKKKALKKIETLYFGENKKKKA